MHEKKLALPYLARAEQQALKVGIFITDYLDVKDENLGLTKILTKFWSNLGQIWPFGHRPKV